jgi:hypothetical protein
MYQSYQKRLSLRALVPCLAAIPLLFTSQAARAVPVQYDFEAGFVTLSATVGGDALIDPITVALTGLQMTVDTATNAVLSMELIAPGPIDLVLNQEYAGYDAMTIEHLALTGSGGSLVQTDPGPPAEYFYLVNPLDMELTLSASGPAPPDGPIDDETFVSPTVASGTLFIDDAIQTLNLSGITIGFFGPFDGEREPIVLKGDFVFDGKESNPIPEPTAALLFSIGLIVVADSSRRRKARGS